MEAQQRYKEIIKSLTAKETENHALKDSTDWIVSAGDILKTKIDEIKNWIDKNRPLLKELETDFDNMKSAIDEVKSKIIDIADKLFEDFNK